MKTMNRVFLMGHIGQKPELVQSKNGRPYTRLNIATDRYRGRDEEEGTDWHSVFVFGDDAQRCVDFLGSGALIFVEGNLSYWKKPAENGESRDNPYKNAVHADRVRFITYGKTPDKTAGAENLDNPTAPRNHNAVAHL